MNTIAVACAFFAFGFFMGGTLITFSEGRRVRMLYRGLEALIRNSRLEQLELAGEPSPEDWKKLGRAEGRVRTLALVGDLVHQIFG